MRSKHIRLLFTIFLMLSTTSTFLWLMSDVLKRNFNYTASEAIGADGTVESNQPLPKGLIDMAKSYDIVLSQALNFTSMAIAEKNTALAHIRAIEQNFPLKGSVKIVSKNNEISEHAKLEKDQIWIDTALKNRLDVMINDAVQLGDHVFHIAGIILSEPIRAGSSFMFAPKIMMRVEDLEKTKLIQPYSRVLYQLFIQADDKTFSTYTHEIKNKFTNLKVYSVQEGRPFANSIFNLADRYLSIFIILMAILSSLGMIVLSEAYAKENVMLIALLKTFGYGQKRIQGLYLSGFIVFGAGSIAVAMLLAITGIMGLHFLFPDYFGFNLSYMKSMNFIKVASSQILALIIILFGFGFFPIIRALKIPAIYLFRKEKLFDSIWPVYLSSIGIILILLLLYIQNYIDVLMLFSYILIAGSILYLVFYFLLLWTQAWGSNLNKILSNSRNLQNTVLATKFSVLFLLVGLLWAISSDFLGSWLESIPENTPNQFMINITDNNKKGIEDYWKNNGVNITFSPMLTAKLKAVNDKTSAFHRNLNLSYMNNLPEGNQKIEGIDWGIGLNGQPVISIEQNFANNIQAKLGDILTFDIGGQEIKGKIVQIRSLKWESFKPNFYVIFPENILEKFPKTYLSSIYLSTEKSGKTTDFLKRFSSISLIDINLTLNQVKTILSKVITVLNYLIAVMLILACLVYYAIISINFFERHYESALLRSMGASKATLRQLILIEFGLIGALSGGCGSLGAIILAMLLSERLSITTYSPNWLFILFGTIVGAVLTMLIGWLSTYKTIHTSPLILLKEGEN